MFNLRKELERVSRLNDVRNENAGRRLSDLEDRLFGASGFLIGPGGLLHTISLGERLTGLENRLEEIEKVIARLHDSTKKG